VEYEIFDHTADVGIKAWGSDLSEAFENAAKGMFSIITDGSKIRSVKEYDISLKARDIEQLLVDWLSELLYLNGAKGMVFGDFDVEVDEGKIELNAKVGGEKYDRKKHGYGAEIKAVTYHLLEVKKKPCMVGVLFDI
jgi:SHS2 domain-containing protein